MPEEPRPTHKAPEQRMDSNFADLRPDPVHPSISNGMQYRATQTGKSGSPGGPLEYFRRQFVMSVSRSDLSNVPGDPEGRVLGPYGGLPSRPRCSSALCPSTRAFAVLRQRLATGKSVFRCPSQSRLRADRSWGLPRKQRLPTKDLSYSTSDGTMAAAPIIAGTVTKS
jgi:hypothetical protein